MYITIRTANEKINSWYYHHMIGEPIPLGVSENGIDVHELFKHVSTMEPTVINAKSIAFDKIHGVLDHSQFPIQPRQRSKLISGGVGIEARMYEVVLTGLMQDPILFGNSISGDDDGSLINTARALHSTSGSLLEKDIGRYKLNRDDGDLLRGLVDAAQLWGRAYLYGFNFDADTNVNFDVLVNDCTAVRKSPEKPPSFPVGYVRNSILQFLKTRMEERIMTHLSTIRHLEKDS